MIAAIYARKSTSQDAVADEQKSVARQIDHARQYATRKGWTVADEHVYLDDGISGAEFANRPAYVKLMSALRPRPPFQVLVMSEESRLGRESIEVGYSLKQLIQAGVRVFFYLEDRERTLSAPVDKMMMALSSFADELERQKAAQRVTDTMVRKARAGHVCGNVVFGYRNRAVLAADGRRSHVVREIEPTEALTVQRIFTLCSQGYGTKATAKILNAEGAPTPRITRGASPTWSPSTLKKVLARPLYRGEVVWNTTKKRDAWGRVQPTPRAAAEWIRVPAPDLQIVSDDLWTAAHARLTAARQLYFDTRPSPPDGLPIVLSASRALLTHMLTCGLCGGPMKARTHAKNRPDLRRQYVCSNYDRRGRAVCRNGSAVPAALADAELLDALLTDVISPTIVREAIDAAVALLDLDGAPTRRLAAIDHDLATVARERDRLVAAVAAGGALTGLLDALKAREARRTALEAERAAIVTARPAQRPDAATLRQDVIARAAKWREILATDPINARPLLASLLHGRAQITPTAAPARRSRYAKHAWTIRGTATLGGLFARAVFRAPILPRAEGTPGVIEFARDFAA